MTVTVCPATGVAAPVEDVWALLADPATYTRWMDVRTVRPVPDGPAAPEQTIDASTRALGRWWVVPIVVEFVDHRTHQIRLRTTLPLGIVVRNHISCAALADGGCLVRFG